MRTSLTLLALLGLVLTASATSLHSQASTAGDTEAEGSLKLELPRFEMPAKMAWPELVGVSAQQAKAQLEAELPDVRVFLVPQDSMMTMDFSLNRVRIIYSQETGLVVAPPRIG